MEFNIEWLEKAAEIESRGDWREMLKFCSEWKIAEPSNHMAWQGVGDALSEFGKFEIAISMYEGALKLAPQKPVDFFGMTMSTAPLWYRIGNAYNKLKQYDMAISAFRNAIGVDPAPAVYWNNLGVAYADKGDINESVEAFRMAAKIEPQNMNFLRNTGIMYARQGMESEVMKIYNDLAIFSLDFADDYLLNAKKTLAELRAK